MATFPAAGYLNNAGRTEGEMKAAFEDQLQATKQIPGAGVAEATLTISGGIVTPTLGVHTIDTEGAAATDNLTNILQTNLPDGSLLLIRCANNARTVVIANAAGGAGQIVTAGFLNLALRSTRQWLLLKRSGTSWEEVTRGGFVLPQPLARLEYVSATQIRLGGGTPAATLVPVWVDGTWRMSQLPTAGVTLSNGGLSATTLYYIYATASGTDVVIEASATGPVVLDGVKVKSGDVTRTLVGAVVTNGSSQFVETNADRRVSSYFSRKRRTASAVDPSTAHGSVSDVPLATGVGFILWEDDAAHFLGTGTVSNSGTNICTTTVYVNGASQRSVDHTSAIANARGNFAVQVPWEPGTTGYVFCELRGKVSAGAGTWLEIHEVATFMG